MGSVHIDSGASAVTRESHPHRDRPSQHPPIRNQVYQVLLFSSGQECVCVCFVTQLLIQWKQEKQCITTRNICMRSTYMSTSPPPPSCLQRCPQRDSLRVTFNLQVKEIVRQHLRILQLSGSHHYHQTRLMCMQSFKACIISGMYCMSVKRLVLKEGITIKRIRWSLINPNYL